MAPKLDVVNPETFRKYFVPVKGMEFIDNLRQCVLPFYEKNDPAHQIGHVDNVINEINYIGEKIKCSSRLIHLATVAAYMHDVFVSVNRDNHHSLARELVMALQYREPLIVDTILCNYSTNEISMIADACFEHRASYEGKLSSIVSEILSAADRGKPNFKKQYDRCIAWTIAHNTVSPQTIKHIADRHMHQKYGRCGYIKYSKLYRDVYGDELEVFWSEIEINCTALVW